MLRPLAYSLQPEPWSLQSILKRGIRRYQTYPDVQPSAIYDEYLLVFIYLFLSFLVLAKTEIGWKERLRYDLFRVDGKSG